MEVGNRSQTPRARQGLKGHCGQNVTLFGSLEIACLTYKLDSVQPYLVDFQDELTDLGGSAKEYTHDIMAINPKLFKGEEVVFPGRTGNEFPDRRYIAEALGE